MGLFFSRHPAVVYAAHYRGCLPRTLPAIGHSRDIRGACVSMRRAMTAARQDRERGASAVEFALLFPVFIALVLGMITAGLSFERWIGITQGAREGGRLGATLSILASSTDGAGVPNGTLSTWLQRVYDTSLQASGLDPADRGFAACVALYDGTTFTKLSAVGTATPAQTAGECYSDGQSGARVQVTMQRDTFWDWFLARTDVTVKGKATTRWEHAP